MIKLQTGHHSDVVCAYKRPTKLHALQVSNVLQPPLPKKAAKLSEMDIFGGCDHRTPPFIGTQRSHLLIYKVQI